MNVKPQDLAVDGPPGPQDVAAALVEAAAHRAFELFRNQAFRAEAALDALDQVEQDRIFNELVAACLVLIMLVLEAPDLRVPAGFRDRLTRLRELVPTAYADSLKALGVEDEHLKVWDKLIAMRYEEYARDRHDVRSAAMHLGSREKPLDLDDLSRIRLLVPVQAVAIGCHHHICRGDPDGRDELFKLTLKALAGFYVDVRLRLEGGKITLLTRARRFLRRMMAGER